MFWYLFVWRADGTAPAVCLYYTRDFSIFFLSIEALWAGELGHFVQCLRTDAEVSGRPKIYSIVYQWAAEHLAGRVSLS